MKLCVSEDRKPIDDGQHTGVVTAANVMTSKKGTEYLQLVLSVDNTGMTIKVNYPLPVSPGNLSGALFGKFGLPVVVGGMVDSQAMLNRLVRYECVRDKGNSRYADVVRESVVPYEVGKQTVM
jgi:hypothetical protein